MKEVKNKVVYDEATLNFRVTKSLKNDISTKASSKNMTMSKYLRELLESIHDGSYGAAKQESNKIRSFLFSMEFLKLIIWILSKRGNDKIVEDRFSLNRYVKTIKKADEYLPDNISKEFDKVLFDILRVLNSYNFELESFKFSDNHDKDVQLNYELVTGFFTTQNVDLHIVKSTY